MKGLGHLHAVHLNLTVNTLIVDDLGHVTGDVHDDPCPVGDGIDSSGKTDNSCLIMRHCG